MTREEVLEAVNKREVMYSQTVHDLQTKRHELSRIRLRLTIGDVSPDVALLELKEKGVIA